MEWVVWFFFFFLPKGLGQCSGQQKMKVTEIIRILEGIRRNLENTSCKV